MPFAGLGLHLLVAVFFAVHALRSGQNMYWLIILFSFPLLGSVVYFLVVYLPNSRLERGARKAVARAARVLDPGRELREARAALDDTPTAQNQMRLAAALLEAGQPDEAVSQYQACLKGPFANDPEIRFGATRALLAAGHAAGAAGHLQFIRGVQADYRAEAVALLLADVLSTAGRSQEARAEYESAIQRFGSFETKAEYLIWALACGERELAGRLQQEVQRATQRWNRHTRELNQPLLARLDAAYSVARGRG